MTKIAILFLVILIGAGLMVYKTKSAAVILAPDVKSVSISPTNLSTSESLSISEMRKKIYPGSEISIVNKLSFNASYDRYVTSYYSDGLKIFSLLTIPKGKAPSGGWPVILFNHGYIAPEVYRTGQRYVSYVDYFARNGYVVFMPDYRGNGLSEGNPEGAYYSPAYATDDLNALASIKKYKDVNPNKIGIWGHSMGGNITLRDLVVDTSGDIKAAVIWGGVVGSYNDLMYNWQHKVKFVPSPRELALRNNNRQRLVDKYGTPVTNPIFWNTLDPTYYLSDINTPLQLHVGGSDEEVPVAFSESLSEKMTSLGKNVEYYVYPGANHNISQGFSLAMKRSLDFFDKYLK